MNDPEPQIQNVSSFHIPVLLKEVLTYLDPHTNDDFIDATLGGGGHSLAILEKTAPQGRILGIEWDEKILQIFKKKLQDNPQIAQRFILVRDNFSHIDKIIRQKKFLQPKGILFDLGLNSWQLDQSGRGFTFRKNEPLDMRFGKENELTAAEIINSWPPSEIAKILREYGEEKYSQRIAQAIFRKRRKEKIIFTSQLVEILSEVLPNQYKRQRLHFATRTFQALRIATNNELINLQEALERTLKILPKNSRIVVISFHSLEDRIVKRFFKKQQDNNILTILTKKPITPTLVEKQLNPRSRSAKLRAAIINLNNKI